MILSNKKSILFIFCLFLFVNINFLVSENKNNCVDCPTKKKCDSEQLAQTNESDEEFAPLDESETKNETNTQDEFQSEDSSNFATDSTVSEKSNSSDGIDSKWMVPLLALLFTIIAGIFVRFPTTRNLRGLFLIASIALLGFLNGACPCPISSFANFVLAITGSEFHWFQIIWFLGLIPITYIFGKVWCGWVCHLGALQEILYLPAKIKQIKNLKYLNIIKYAQIIILIAMTLHIIVLISNMFWQFFEYSILLNFKIFGVGLYFTFVDILWVLLFLLLLSFLLRHSEELMKLMRVVFLIGFIFWLIGEDAYLFNKYDPFKTAFNLGYNANQAELILLILMLLSSVFLQRPFCKTACPIGLILGWIARIPGASVLGNKGNCNGCRLCSISCKNSAIQRKNDHSILDNEECISCGECIDACKLDSLKYYRKSKLRPVKVMCKRESKIETIDSFFEREFNQTKK